MRVCRCSRVSGFICVLAPHISAFFMICLLLLPAYHFLYHTVPQALELSKLWKPRYNSSRTASCVDHFWRAFGLHKGVDGVCMCYDT